MPVNRTIDVPKPSAEYTVRDQERMRAARNYFDWQSRMVEPHVGRRVIEIGCGVGNFSRYLADRERLIGLDVEPACIEEWQREFAGRPGMSAQVMDVVDPTFLHLKAERPDTIVCLNVLEHIEDDVQALRHMHDVLPTGGRALLIVPAYEALYGPIDRNLGHYRRYSSGSFRKTAAALGFRTTLRYMNTIGMVGWWVNAKILKKTEQSAAQIQLFDSAVVPLMSKLEALLPPPFGQSIFAVLERVK